MTSVGETLRREREKQERVMAEIAEELCITQRYLRAIEEDDLKSLPGTFFYKSFVKQYASLLNLDKKKLQPGVDALTAIEEPLPLPGANPKYHPLREVDPIVADSNLPAPAQLQAVSASSTPGINVSTEPDGVNKVVLNLSATEKTWLSIVSDGRQIFAGVLEPAQTKILKSVDMARLKIGNAGGLEVTLNGRPIPPIGPRGQVRSVVFTPGSYQVLPPEPPKTL